jgi:hypothetical protein
MLGNGVDLDKFNPNRFDENFKAEKRKEVGLPADAIVIGIITAFTVNYFKNPKN